MYTIYTGERVRLRPYKDYEEFRACVDTSMRQPNDHWGPWYWPAGERKKEFEPHGMLEPTKYSQFAVERLDSGAVIGHEEHGAMEPGRLDCWLGTEIHREHWSNGFGLEAKQLMLCYLFENYPLETVRADTCSHHTRAWRGLEACGMRHIGALKGCHYADGVRLDIPQFQIFREEWLELGYWRKVKRGM